MISLLQALNDSALGAAMRGTIWMFPLMETLHFIGLCALFGALLFIDLRLLGFARAFPIAATGRLIPLAAAGVATNVISGFCLFSSDPVGYWANEGFRIKMVLVVLGGLNALWFEVREREGTLHLPSDGQAALSTRVVAGLSLGLWIVVLALGRLLPYTK